MKVIQWALLAIISTLAVAGCKKKATESPAANQEQSQSAEPERIKVQHILIGFSGSIPGQKIERSQEDAKKLAYEILEKSKAPNADFEALVKQYSEDRPPGIYEMTNNGVPPSAGAFPRNGMVPAFGNVGFKLNVGEVGIADFDPQNSPYGFHVIKRLN